MEEDRLISAMSSPSLGFHEGRPLAAVIAFRCCIHWRAFQASLFWISS